MAADGEVVIRQLGQLGLDLLKEVDLYGDLEVEAVDTEGDYRAAFAKVYKDSLGNMEERKQAAIAATDAEWRTWGKALAAVKRQRESLRALHARVDIGRTMASRDKALVSLAGRDGAA